MKFSNVIVIALSLGCRVLAAPAAPTHAPVAGFNALPANVPLEDVADVEAQAADVHLEDVPAVLPARSLPVSSPNTAMIEGAVSGLKNSVSGELSTIMSMSAKNAASYDIPVIKNSLANIATHMKAATTGMAPALVAAATYLTAEETQSLLCALNEIEGIVFNLKSALSTILSNIEAGAKGLIAPEIATVLGLTMPLVAPLIGSVYITVGSLPGGDAVTTELTTVAGSVMGDAVALKTLGGH
ncbi:uncharacterized protein K444DRAFT_659724 [Hyaloscypha bicolor E]|uniref:Cell wall protein n=1 Tax=Hyaloscypha bicolor E TaxID=1095630 RepID=A0A2J6TR89_9HELO|nr:uncharacterized protein K444DRAFT_659724 [Hyaloscypha bicolor E]PMD65512.1 hypothetical protein K444DRAFT_659724 [Hyaloscypha bicolor E]